MTGPVSRPVWPVRQESELREKLSAELFAESRIGVYAVLDGASIPDLRQALYAWYPEHECLYRGELTPDIAEAAPYLVRMQPGSDFCTWVMEKGWGNHWGVYALSYAVV